jgi:NhaP-type Na+/H+ or K+/H+ antiporter
MSTHLVLDGTENVALGLAIACINLIVAIALVVVGLSLVLAVSSVAWLSDRTGETQSIRGQA